ncbi:MAG TPA: hypothetical protein VGE50_00960 [Gammaproteobacteria bacterium]
MDVKKGLALFPAVALRTLFALLISLIVACSSGDSASNQPAASSGVTAVGTATPAANPRIFSKAAAELIEEFDLSLGVMVIKVGKGVPADLGPGKIIAAPISTHTPYGAMVKISAASLEGDRWHLTVERATLVEALAEADFTAKVNLDANRSTIVPDFGGVSAAAPKALVRSDGSSSRSGFVVGFDNKVLFDADGDNLTTTDQVRMTAAMSFDLGLDFTFKMDSALSVQEVSATVNGKESGTVEVTAEGVSTVQGFSLDTVHFTPIEFSVGGIPFVVAPTLEFTAEVDVNTTAKFRTSASEEAWFRVGPGYKNSELTLIKEGGATGTYQAPTISGSQASAKGSFGVRGGLNLYGPLGDMGAAWAGASGFARVAVAAANNTQFCATADVGVEADAGANLSFFGVNIASWTSPKANLFAPIVLDSKACNVTSGGGDDPRIGWRYVADGTADSLTGLQAVATTLDGGLVFARSSNTFNYVQKHDSLGVADWRYGTSVGLTITRLAAAADGGYIVVGSYGSSIAVLRLDPAGTLRWSKLYQPDAIMFVNAVAEAADGTLLIAGKMYDSVDPSDDIFLLRTAADGTLPSLLRLKGPVGSDGANAVLGGADGRVYLAGLTWLNTTSGSSAPYGFVAAIAQDDSVTWVKGVGPGEILSMASDGAGGVVVTGADTLLDTPWTARVDSNGGRMWGSGVALDARPVSISRTTDGVVIAGVAQPGYPLSDEQGFVARFGDGGGLLWARTFRYELKEQYLAHIYERSDGRLVAGGYRVPADGMTDFWWLSLPADGAAAGAPLGTQVTTPEGAAVTSLGESVNGSLSVIPRAVVESVLDMEWTAQTAPAPLVLGDL